MSITTNLTSITLTEDTSGNIIAWYTISQGCSDFPGQTTNMLRGSFTIPTGDTAAVADLLAAAKTAAGV